MITSTLNETKVQIDYHFLFELSAAFWEMSPLPSPNSWEKDQIQKKRQQKKTFWSALVTELIVHTMNTPRYFPEF